MFTCSSVSPSGWAGRVFTCSSVKPSGWEDRVFTCSSVNPSGWEGRVWCLPVVLSTPLAGSGRVWCLPVVLSTPLAGSGRVWCLPVVQSSPLAGSGRVGCLPVVLSSPLAGSGRVGCLPVALSTPLAGRVGWLRGSLPSQRRPRAMFPPPHPLHLSWPSVIASMPVCPAPSVYDRTITNAHNLASVGSIQTFTKTKTTITKAPVLYAWLAQLNYF